MIYFTKVAKRERISSGQGVWSTILVFHIGYLDHSLLPSHVHTQGAGPEAEQLGHELTHSDNMGCWHDGSADPRIPGF